MKIESVTVSVGCGDYLRYTLPFNKHLFNRSVVVTSPDDAETQRVCKYYNVEVVVTDQMFSEGQKFNKGLAVNAGLNAIDFKEWAVHLDADIILPPLTRHLLEGMLLNEQCIYGMDRVMVPNYEYWERFISNPTPQHEDAYVHVGPFPVGTRLNKIEQGGWIPLGYFQMFHRAANCLGPAPYYPTQYDSAASSDLCFAYKWPRTHRMFLPEIICYHLATDDITNAPMGVNWDGRVSSRFGPKDPYTGNFRRVTPPKKEISIVDK